ncbi:ANTAR domain-containing protein [Streptomyces sp. NPDC050617]|uniref:ANTAR domain-containing response regulator n=1 Tax=Streptomyces sp. NPDC050617 TaxID=3154628 RepID=UPI003449AFEC
MSTSIAQVAGASEYGAESLDRGLAHLAEQAAWCAPDSCGATVTAVADGSEDASTAATHPDLSTLVTAQLETGEGPIPAALDSGREAAADDLLHDRRWPAFRARALDVGVRSSATLVFSRDALTVTLSVYGFRPGPLPQEAHEATEMLGDLALTNFVRDRRYRRALAEVDQLDTALRRRPVVDQACGIAMYVLGCDAEEAFDLLRRHSQRANRKLADLAEVVVRTRGHGLEGELRKLRREAGPAAADAAAPEAGARPAGS